MPVAVYGGEQEIQWHTGRFVPWRLWARCLAPAVVGEVPAANKTGGE